MRRLFGLRTPTTSHEAFQNLIRAGWWEFGLLAVAVLVAFVLRDAFQSPAAWFWPVVYAVILAPPAAATLAVAGEMVAALRLRLRERRSQARSGNPLIDHDVLVGVVVVAGLIALGVYLGALRPR